MEIQSFHSKDTVEYLLQHLVKCSRSFRAHSSLEELW